MSAVYLDTNFFISLVEPRGNLTLDVYENYNLCVSTLSLHIFAYVYKRKMPDQQFVDFSQYYSLVDLTEEIITRAAVGPTSDFEDNIQLNSAAAAKCNYFLTQDKELLKLRFFGSVEIRSQLPQ